jgi:hypothetical protein
LLISFISAFLLGCVSEKDQVNLTKEQMLDMALMHDYAHLQSETAMQLLKSNNVKSASFVNEIKSENKTDSVTFLKFDKKGRILSRTTTECTTVGCLPYTIRQVYLYEGNKPVQMQDFTFDYKYDHVKDYWTMSDTGKLTKFDWEDYTYYGDTIRVESGSQIWEYVVNSKNKLTYRRLRAKATGQSVNSHFEYGKNRIDLKILNERTGKTYKATYRTESSNTIILLKNYGENKVYKNKYIFGNNGLISGINHFKDGKVTKKTEVEYSYFNGS